MADSPQITVNSHNIAPIDALGNLSPQLVETIMNSQFGELDGEKILFTPKSIAQYEEYIDYGKKTAKNLNELGVALVGVQYVLNGQRLDIVDEVIPFYKAIGTPARLDIPNEAYEETHEILNQLRLEYAGGERLNIVGWLHTHPDPYPVFMSGVDKPTQKQNFKDQFAVVVNPHRKIKGAYFGENSIPCAMAEIAGYKKIKIFEPLSTHNIQNDTDDRIYGFGVEQPERISPSIKAQVERKRKLDEYAQIIADNERDIAELQDFERGL